MVKLKQRGKKLRGFAAVIGLLFLILQPFKLQAAVTPTDAGWLFNADTLDINPQLLFEVRLHMSQAVFDRLSLIETYLDPRADVYETVDLELFCGDFLQERCGGTSSQVWSGVSVKMKGQAGSFRPMSGKPGFKVKFKKTELFFGLAKLTLNNNVQDATRMNQTLSYDVFRASGIAAPRTGYARVSIIVEGSQTQDYGLYLNVETPDNLFLLDHFGGFQHLYEATYGTDVLPGSEPVDPSASGHYEIQEGSKSDYSDLTSLINTANNFGAGGNRFAAQGIEAWFAAIQTKADMAQMTRYWAVESYIGHWDGYLSLNNYFLFSDSAGRFSLLPWGTDNTLQTDSHFLLGPGLLEARCKLSSACRELHDSALQTVLTTAIALDLGAKAERLFTVLAPYIDADPRKEDTLADSIAAKNAAVLFIAARPGRVDAYRQCVPDADFDGISDCEDVFPLQSRAATDTDRDGMPDSWLQSCPDVCQGLTLDTDDDNDGIPDVIDQNPLIPLSLNGVFKGSHIREKTTMNKR